MRIASREFSSIDEVLAEFGSDFHAIPSRLHGVRSPMLYRGHKSDTWQLKPFLIREAEAKNKNLIAKLNLATQRHRRLVERIDEATHRRLLCDAMDELQFDSVFEFSQLLHEQGLLPASCLVDMSAVSDYAIRKDHAMPLLPGAHSLVAMAQHHGIPTLLLDWTRDPMVALWFSVRDRPIEMKEPAVVWMLPRVCLPHLDSNTISLLLATDQRFPRAQSGCFTFDNSWRSKYIETGRFRSLEDVIESAPDCIDRFGCKHHPVKFIIPADLVHDVEFRLRGRGYYLPHLMPSVESCATYTKRNYDLPT